MGGEGEGGRLGLFSSPLPGLFSPLLPGTHGLITGASAGADAGGGGTLARRRMGMGGRRAAAAVSPSPPPQKKARLEADHVNGVESPRLF